MAPDPMSVTVFGQDEGRRVRGLRTTFRLTLRALKRPALIATREGEIVGVAAFARPSECFFKQMDSRRKTVRIGNRSIAFAVPSLPLRTLFSYLRLGPTTLSRMSVWTETTARNDPKEAHQHIELVAVAPEYQRQGIGRLMMDRALEEMKSLPGMPYLETNTEADVRFYERLGFEILHSVEAMNVTIRFMAIRQWPRVPPEESDLTSKLPP